MRITPEKSAPTPARILARANQMAETAEEAEMRELEEGVARLNDAGAPLLEAEDAQGCDSKGDALAHSKSSENRAN